MLDAARIAALLAPFFGEHPLPAEIIPQLQAYLDLLLRWNARMNLTAVRGPEQIVTRHFGESLFAGRVLVEAGAFVETSLTLCDIGSGAGFPGIPIKLLVPHLRVTLVEAHHKKAAFLREVIRHLELSDIEVFCGRAESLTTQYLAVTLRAVEKFDSVLPIASSLVSPGGSLCLLVGQGQRAEAELSSKTWSPKEVHSIPRSNARVVIIALKCALETGKW